MSPNQLFLGHPLGRVPYSLSLWATGTPPRDFMLLCFSKPPWSELPPKKVCPKLEAQERFMATYVYIVFARYCQIFQTLITFY